MDKQWKCFKLLMFIHFCIQVTVQINVFLFISVHSKAILDRYRRTHVYMHAYAPTHMHTHTHTHTHTHMHAGTHTPTHTNTHKSEDRMKLGVG